jgi:hypothetical protein
MCVINSLYKIGAIKDAIKIMQDRDVTKAAKERAKMYLRPIFYKVRLFWFFLIISLLIALYYAYLETARESNLFDMFLPRYNITQTGNATVIAFNGTQAFDPTRIQPPFIPRFVILWGYIGAATYVLKVTTKKIYSEKGFNEKSIPDHIARLFIGTVIAVVMFFILVTGGFFGLTIDVTKIANPNVIQYVYAAIAFISGYSVRHIIEIISQMISTIFRHDKIERKEE